ncbi:DMT family transporter [Acinetobacter qingfengensis]|uniref:EamA domain-containing protein n=1 Tax=Acinetobacter qingfengensis TaxID=1262585 RepID=A0A1E7QWH5_9GAMM|nr:DMT family transporter [Acinetobacter qingfengensis]KAA8731302.1 DMT family transporter [Acinetobacter qingfengensis]OEY91449.1 hypothetical protein BJI46_06865 [Acinetobacter qingfengensis]
MILKSDMLIYLKLTCVALLWGGTFIAGRIVAADIPPYAAALLRFMIASALLIIILVKVEGSFKRISLSQHFLAAGMGLTGVFTYNIFFFNALSHMEAGRTALFVSLSPILTVIAARFFFKEKLAVLNYYGVIIAFLGTLIVVTKGQLFSQLSSSFGVGELMMSGAVLSWVIYTLLCRQSKFLSPLIMTTYSTLWGTLFLLISSIPKIQQWQTLNFKFSTCLSIIYLGAFGTVLAFIWYMQGIAKIGTSRTIIFNNLVPVFAILLSFFILNEPITLSMLIGGVLCFSGVLLTNKRDNLDLNKNTDHGVKSNA